MVTFKQTSVVVRPCLLLSTVKGFFSFSSSAELVNGRDASKKAPFHFEQLLERKMTSIVSEDSYDPLALAASVILSHQGHTPQAFPTAPT